MTIADPVKNGVRGSARKHEIHKLSSVHTRIRENNCCCKKLIKNCFLWDSHFGNFLECLPCFKTLVWDVWSKKDIKMIALSILTGLKGLQ